MSLLDPDYPENRPLSVIFGLAGTKLSQKEREFFARTNPLGFILFSRNCESPEQLRDLTASLRDCLGRGVPILVDQEGGRVARLKPPHWPDYPSAKTFGDIFKSHFSKGLEAVEKNTQAIARDLEAVGITVNCAPVLDVLCAQTHDAIGDRAFSSDPKMVSALGASVCQTYVRNGIIPIVKHMPGQGRATLDSHKDLPHIHATMEALRHSDFVPFKDMLSRAFSEAMWGMVAHVIYEAIDERMPATCSRRVIWDVIREEIGFTGLLLSDDICMDALADYGDMAERTRAVLKGGCDIVLHCNGDMEEMETIASKDMRMTDKAVERFNCSVLRVQCGKQ